VSEGKVSDMLGVTMVSVFCERGGDRDDVLVFVANDGRKFTFRHDHDCCETVSIESIDGDLDDLVDSLLLRPRSHQRERQPRRCGYPRLPGFIHLDVLQVRHGKGLRDNPLVWRK